MKRGRKPLYDIEGMSRGDQIEVPVAFKNQYLHKFRKKYPHYDLVSEEHGGTAYIKRM